MRIVSGSSSLMLSSRLSEITKIPMAHREIKRFSDGECYVRLHENLDGEDVILVQNTYPDSNIIEYFLLVDAIRQYKIKSLTSVIPYFGYGRQDKRFNEGEPISAKVFAEHLSENVDRILTINLHNPEVINWFKVPAIEIRAEKVLAKYFEKFNPDIIVSPDKGSIERAKYLSELLNKPFISLEKKRIDSDNVEIHTGDIDVKNKVVAIIDDMISTGGTISTASTILKNLGASKIVVGCIHGLFVANALNRIQRTVDIIFSTDTIENEKSVVTVAEEIASKIL
ncbi:MAG: ribose-phosphate diphosphokinase [Thermoplasmata archaeon]|nr:ribose-phosphate diphosphokinase [Thermoplasmata archaeon]